MPPIPDYPGRPGFETLCPVSRVNPTRYAIYCPGFPARPSTHREFASMIQKQCRNFSKYCIYIIETKLRCFPRVGCRWTRLLRDCYNRGLAVIVSHFNSGGGRIVLRKLTNAWELGLPVSK